MPAAAARLWAENSVPCPQRLPARRECIYDGRKSRARARAPGKTACSVTGCWPSRCAVLPSCRPPRRFRRNPSSAIWACRTACPIRSSTPSTRTGRVTSGSEPRTAWPVLTVASSRSIGTPPATTARCRPTRSPCCTSMPATGSGSASRALACTGWTTTITASPPCPCSRTSRRWTSGPSPPTPKVRFGSAPSATACSAWRRMAQSGISCRRPGNPGCRTRTCCPWRSMPRARCGSPPVPASCSGATAASSRSTTAG